MRLASIALLTAAALLAACGGPETSQANNAQANISNDSRVANQAAPSNAEARLSLGDAANVMKDRHEGMEAIGKNFKVANRELSGAAPDISAVRASAAAINQLANKASGWFPEGTGPDVGKTGAKPDIWLPENQKDFAIKLHNLQVAAVRFNAAASGNDLAATKARFTELGGACKACHDKYRMDMHH